MRTLLYVSGPMTGLADFNYPAFGEATAALRSAGYTVLCPTEADHGAEPGALPWEEYLRRALADLLQARGVALLDGWWRSRGAQLEVHVARALGMPCEPVDLWLWTNPEEAA